MNVFFWILSRSLLWGPGFPHLCPQFKAPFSEVGPFRLELSLLLALLLLDPPLDRLSSLSQPIPRFTFCPDGPPWTPLGWWLFTLYPPSMVNLYKNHLPLLIIALPLFLCCFVHLLLCLPDSKHLQAEATPCTLSVFTCIYWNLQPCHQASSQKVL